MLKSTYADLLQRPHANAHQDTTVAFFRITFPLSCSFPQRLTEVDEAVMALQNALEEVETTPGELTDNVVTFSASDFSRTLSSNGNGSDHDWGANHFVISVANNLNASVWGDDPTDLDNVEHPEVGNLDVNRGRLLPTTSVDEYSAELAMWFGIPDDSNLEIVLPNIRNFHSAGGKPVGFLR